MASSLTLPKLPSTAERRAWFLWCVFAVVIAVIIIARIKPSWVTATYFPTASRWWRSAGDIYTEGIKGYLYLPQSLYLFTPFLALPEGPVREIVWRLFGLALLAFGLRRVLRRTAADGGARHFEMVTLLVVLATASSARNGQTNLHLAGLILHACADLLDRRWWRATLLLWGGMLAKPIALVMILLVGALYRAMRVRLLVGLVAFVCLPVLHPDPAYALEQYGQGWHKLTRSAQPGSKSYDDFVGLLRSLGITLPQAVRTAIALLAALLTLLLARLGLKRGGPMQGAWILAALAAAYLMLFNPRTETNSYVILAPWLALLAAASFFDRGDRRMFVVFVVGCLALGCDNYGRPFHEATRGLLKPAVALVFMLYLAVRVRSLATRPLLLPTSSGPDAPDTHA